VLFQHKAKAKRWKGHPPSDCTHSMPNATWDKKLRNATGALGLLVVVGCCYVFAKAWRPRVVTSAHVVVALPAGRTFRHDDKWVLWIHGVDDTGAGMFNNYGSALSSALLKAGYVLVSPDDSDPTCWGNARCVRDIESSVELARTQFGLRSEPYVYAMSMGGLVAMNAITDGVLHPRALFESYPVFSLASMYDGGHGYYADSIERAYGFQTTSQYGASTAGFDPSINEVEQFVSFPIRVACSDGDTTVSCAANGRALVSAVQRAGGSASYYPCSGNHGDLSCIPPAGVVKFFSEH
jgi:hypothetical protein